ncbi:MAG: hypothetical protein ABI867_12185 [Kofleriaceae bacterium]
MRMLALVIAMTACSGKPIDPVHTPAGPKPCERMADHVVGVLMEGKQHDSKDKDEADALRATSDAISRVLVERCSKDAWSMDAQKCFLEIKTLEDSATCAPLLTVEQRNGMDAAIDAALGPRPAAGSASEPQ